MVQCKRWRARKVGVEIVRELYGVMSARGAVGGYVVSVGVFSDEAKRFAQGRNIELWHGKMLKAKIRREPQRPVATASGTGPGRTAERCPDTRHAIVPDLRQPDG